MLLQCLYCPDIFKELEGGSFTFYEAKHEGATYAWLAVFQVYDQVQLHVEVVKLTPGTYRQMRADFKDFLEACRVNGCKSVAAYSHPDNKLWPKYIKRFGFSEPQKIMLSVMEVPHE
jgi:hypothetical protein